MTETEPKASGPATSPEAAKAKYGITRVTVDYFHYKDYRYTNLKDAIAQAKRQEIVR